MPPSPLPPVPVQLSELREILGSDELVLKFVLRFGGLRVVIPRTARPCSAIALEVGFDAAKALVSAWGGDRPRIPLVRWWLARCLKAQGKSTSQIAAVLKITETSVPDLLNGRRPSRGSMEDLAGPKPAVKKPTKVPA